MSNTLWVIICIVIYNIVAFLPFLWIKYNGNVYKFKDSNKNQLSGLFFTIILLYCVFDHTGGDYFHYKEIVGSIFKYQRDESHLESFYIWLSKFIGFSYHLWRFVIWGLALYIIRYLILKQKFDILYCWWLFSIISLLSFSTGRVSLGVAVAILSIYTIFKKKNILHIAAGITLFIIAFYLHKSSIIIIACLLISCLRFSKITIILLILGISVIAYYVYSNLYELSIIQSSDLSSSTYISAERSSYGLSEIINLTLMWIPLAYFLIRYYVHSNKQNKFIHILAKSSFLLILIAILIYFIGVGSIAIPNRIKNLAFVPLFFVSAYYFKDKKFRTTDIISLSVLYISDIYYLLYMLYLKSIGLGV